MPVSAQGLGTGWVNFFLCCQGDWTERKEEKQQLQTLYRAMKGKCWASWNSQILPFPPPLSLLILPGFWIVWAYNWEGMYSIDSLWLARGEGARVPTIKQREEQREINIQLLPCLTKETEAAVVLLPCSFLSALTGSAKGTPRLWWRHLFLSLF